MWCALKHFTICAPTRESNWILHGIPTKDIDAHLEMERVKRDISTETWTWNMCFAKKKKKNCGLWRRPEWIECLFVDPLLTTNEELLLFSMIEETLLILYGVEWNISNSSESCELFPYLAWYWVESWLFGTRDLPCLISVWDMFGGSFT